MKAIDLANVVVRTADGREFVVAAIDDFTDEVARTAANPALTRLLSERSKDHMRYTLEQVRAKLGEQR